MNVYVFGPSGFLRNPTNWADYLDSELHILWVDMVGPTPEHIRMMQEVFMFHPLAIEDTHNNAQRGKVEEYETHLFVISNPVFYREPQEEVETCEMDIFLGRNYIVTVHENGAPIIEEGLKRAQQQKAKVSMSPGFLLYCLSDAIVDSYFPVIERIGAEIEHAEDLILSGKQSEILNQLIKLKRALRTLSHVIWPQQDVFHYLMYHSGSYLDQRSLEYYFRDVHDHVLRVAAMVTTMRDTLTGVVDLHMSSISNRLNRVVGRLTVFTLTIGALTVIGGFYGMNFEVTWPPFNDPNGVIFALGLMAAIALVSVFYLMYHYDRN